MIRLAKLYFQRMKSRINFSFLTIAWNRFGKMVFNPLNKKRTLNAAWFFFIVVGMGQLGPFIGYAAAYWSDKSVVDSIQVSAGKAELLTCATAILAGGIFFLVKEYNSPGNIENRFLKSFALLWSAILGLLCILTTAQLLTTPGFSSIKQSWVHWILYFVAIVTAFLLWLLEEMQGSAQHAVQMIAAEAEDLTEKARSEKTAEGLKV